MCHETGLERFEIEAVLNDLWRSGLVSGDAGNGYRLTEAGLRTYPVRTKWVRPQPIRDAILAYLSEPRFVRDIALHIRRPVPTTTGHLAAMRRRGLVKRIGPAVYALPDSVMAAPVSPCARQDKPPAGRRSIALLLTQPRSVAALCKETALPRAEVEAALNSLWLGGLVTDDARDGYRLTASGRHAYSASLPEAAMAAPDAGAANSSGTRVRSHPTRHAILAYLTEPRCTRDIALHIKPLGTMSRYLAAPRREDLIRRIGHGVHTRTDSKPVVSVSKPARAATPRALCTHIVPLLTWRRSVQGLSLETGLKKADIAAVLDELWLLALVSGDAASGYRLTAAGVRRYAVSAPIDANAHLPHTEAVLPRAVRRALG